MSRIRSAGILLKYGDKYLLGTSAKDPYSTNGWGVPKGKVEKEESLADAALREFNEETGLDISTIFCRVHLETPFCEFQVKLKKSSKKEVTVFLVEALDVGILKYKFECPINKEGVRELNNFRWVTAKEGLALVTKSQKPIFEKILSNGTGTNS